jgi:DNA mismatch repair ATPase MutL
MPLEPLEIHLFQETEHTLNFVNYAFRHKTLTLLGEVKQCQEKYDEKYFGYENISAVKSKMQELFDEMRAIYMSTNDKFIKMLCDDIHIAMKTIGTRYGQMCISSRQTSQGTQRIYTVNTTPLDRVKVNTRSSTYDSDSDSDDIQRASMSACARPKPKQRACMPSSFNIDPDQSDEYEVSNNCMIDSPYLTQTVTSVMRTISNISDEDSDSSSSDEEDDNDKNDSDEEDDNDKNDSDEEDDNDEEDEKITGLFQDTPVKIDNNNIGPLTKF